MPNRLIYGKDTPLADSNITDLLKLHMGLGTTVIIEHTENRTGLNGEPFDILGRLYAFSEETEKTGAHKLCLGTFPYSQFCRGAYK